jgi:glycosyltransferase involved in cell wall biosynthesis
VRVFFTNFHLGWGGQPLQVILLAQAMKAQNHTPIIFAPPGSELAERSAQQGLPVNTGCRFPRGFRPVKVVADLIAMRRAIRRESPDIIHCHGSQDTWLSVLAVRSMGKARPALLRTKHNSYPARRHMANRWLYNRGLDRVIAVAEPIRDELVSDRFVDPARVEVIHACLDDRVLTSPRTPPKAIWEEFGIPPDAPLIGLVGRLAPDKGQDTLLHAASTILEEFPQARFLLVGTGGDWDRIRALIAELGLGKHVIWAGFRDDVPSVTAALDVSVLAARACDASSTVVKEAMALEVPVVATRVGGTAEILADGKCGILVEPGDPKALAEGILKILRDPDAAQARAQIARQRVEAYLASQIATRTEEIYHHAVKEKASR